jgi:hypothetical protein
MTCRRPLDEATVETIEGFCLHCWQPGLVGRFRVPDQGLYFLDLACAERLDRMGLELTPVTLEDPRREDRGFLARRRLSLGRRPRILAGRLVPA